MKQAALLGWVLLVFCSPGAPCASGADKVDFQNATDLQALHSEVQAIAQNPEAKAEEYLARLKTAPLYGWEAQMLLTFQALDLVGYYFSVEKAQFYASANKWAAPEHSLKSAHLDFYFKKLNPKAQPYSNGVLLDPFVKFSEKLLFGLWSQGTQETEAKNIGFLNLLLSTDREFWQHAVIRDLFEDHRVPTAFLAAVLPQVLKTQGHWDSNHGDLINAILPRSDARVLIGVLASHAALRGQLQKVIDHQVPFWLEGKTNCGDVLKEIASRARF